MLRPLRELAASWRQAGLLQRGSRRAGGAEGAVSEEAAGETARLLLYCGSGWRSSLAWLVARLLGHPSASSFDGGLLEWAAAALDAH